MFIILFSNPKIVQKKDWVVHCQQAGYGQEIIKYIAPYVYRVAISNHKLIKLEDRKVTFKYEDSETNETKTCTLNVLEFIRRFLQHVLPNGFTNIFRISKGSFSQKTYQFKKFQVMAGHFFTIQCANSK
jgi:hypothetical protein